MQCNESTAIVKKINFEILTYLYDLRLPEYINTFFTVMYGNNCACVYVCMRLIMIASKRCFPIEFNFDMYYGHCRMNPIESGERRMYSFLTGVQKIIPKLYEIWSRIMRTERMSKWFIQLS